MGRKRTAEATDTLPPETAPDVFDQAIADRQAAEAAQVVAQVAEATAMPENGHTSHAAAVGKKKYTPAKDPRGMHIIDLSPDPKGPKARLLRSEKHKDMWVQFTENPGKEITDQLKESGFHWERRAETEFAKGAWLLPLEPGNEWRGHAHAERVFQDVVNQIREKNGMEAFVPGAAQSAG